MKKVSAFLPALVFALGFIFLAACGQSAPENVTVKKSLQLQNLKKARPILMWQKTEKWPVNAVLFSPDGKHITAGSERGLINVWRGAE
jgi:GH43 family beta-xylosidase